MNINFKKWLITVALIAGGTMAGQTAIVTTGVGMAMEQLSTPRGDAE